VCRQGFGGSDDDAIQRAAVPAEQSPETTRLPKERHRWLDRDEPSPRIECRAVDAGLHVWYLEPSTSAPDGLEQDQAVIGLDDAGHREPSVVSHQRRVSALAAWQRD
jgi:hypothetical protein